VVVLAVLSAMGFAVGAWLLATGLWERPAASPAAPAHRARRLPQLPASLRVERVALMATAGVLVLLVSRWPVAGVGAAVAAWWVPLPGQRAARQKAEARTAALAQWCASLRDAAGTARGIEGILTATAPAAPAPIRAEIGRMATRLEGQRLDLVLDRLAEDLDHPIGDLVVTALRLASTAGSRRVRQVLGDLAVAAELEASMRRRVDVARERPRSTVRLVAIIVTAFVAGLVVFAGDYLDPYSTAVGQLVLTGIALYWAAGFWWLARLGKVPQAQRFLVPRGAR
jgi:tight adherence protein B